MVELASRLNLTDAEPSEGLGGRQAKTISESKLYRYANRAMEHLKADGLIENPERGIYCPPNDARPASGIVYRLVKNNPPNKDDFISIAKRCPNEINRESGKPNSETCQAHGLSVYEDKNDALINKKRFRYFRDAKLAIANLTPECGQIKNTPTNDTPSHHTLWLPCEMEIWQVFVIEEQVDEQ